MLIKIKHSTMKHLFFILAVAGSLAACNDDTATKTPGGDTAASAPAVSSPAADAPAVPAATVKDSVMQFKDGKVMISANGSWAPLTATVTTSNGRKVSPDGEVSKGKVKRKLEEGMMIDKDGQMTDKDGKMLDNTGWE